jgi:hypothetical protein
MWSEESILEGGMRVCHVTAVGDHSDWGEKHLKEHLGHLFTKNVGR